jgi:hypothetical protein
VALLMTKFWSDHTIRRESFGGRAQFVDLSFKTGFRLRVLNCYIPDKNHHDHSKTSNWVKTKIQEARDKGSCSILLGDFNGVMDPRADRSPRRGGAQPETELLQWLQTQTLYDAYRSIHPTTKGYSFGSTSRIDMIFVSQTLAHRFIECSHDSLAGIADSDHHMVKLSLTLHGSQHLTRSRPKQHKKPTGFRFLFREADTDEFDEFCKKLTQQLDKEKEQLEAIGIKPLDEKETEAEAEQIDGERM